ncbi:uncharacterized protein KD926_001616 [Aspergillus affinis]|uniref:uncharacterized protein n=1 Tax=Aspergillus affinis TaxID=1070780 RepID=UPI0022FF0B1F|nr:uncharacterized protein KD926_001616 [Aspergillus affinis]KAI9036662.1 hypothetical protein KD926_001616 [Aspergillus affinis]
MTDSQLYFRDISQAYVQLTTKLNRELYARLPKELIDQLGLTSNTVMRVIKPLYGIPEAENYWFRTYHSHHLEHLRMSQSTFDPCLLYTMDSPNSRESTGFGIVGLQTDDTLILADATFAESEEIELQKAQFLAKDREKLTIEKPLKFNGSMVKLEPDRITLTQEIQCIKLSPIGKLITQAPGTLKDRYIAERARGTYIASVCQPEASFDLSFAAQVINPSKKDAESLNKRLNWQLENAARGLKYVKLDLKSLQLLVFTDASFANNKDLSSQIGYVIVLADKRNASNTTAVNANIVHWSSIKCKRVTRSVLASELYAMAHGSDIAFAIKSTLDQILQTNIPIVLCTESKSLYDCLVRLGSTQEKRLMINIMYLRQAYKCRQITDIKWIDGDSNPADIMTKSKLCNALRQLIDTNCIDLQAIGWVERSN